MHLACPSCSCRAAHFPCIQQNQTPFLCTKIPFPLESQKFPEISKKFLEKAAIPQNSFSTREGPSAAFNQKSAAFQQNKSAAFKKKNERLKKRALHTIKRAPYDGPNSPVFYILYSISCILWRPATRERCIRQKKKALHTIKELHMMTQIALFSVFNILYSIFSVFYILCSVETFAQRCESVPGSREQTIKKVRHESHMCFSKGLSKEPYASIKRGV